AVELESRRVGGGAGGDRWSMGLGRYATRMADPGGGPAIGAPLHARVWRGAVDGETARRDRLVARPGRAVRLGLAARRGAGCCSVRALGRASSSVGRPDRHLPGIWAALPWGRPDALRTLGPLAGTRTR